MSPSLHLPKVLCMATWVY